MKIGTTLICIVNLSSRFNTKEPFSSKSVTYDPKENNHDTISTYGAIPYHTIYLRRTLSIQFANLLYPHRWRGGKVADRTVGNLLARLRQMPAVRP